MNLEVLDVKTEYDVILTGLGNSKVAIMKEIRSILGLDLKEAKAFVESLGNTIKEKVSVKEAEELKKQLESAGAVIELKGY